MNAEERLLNYRYWILELDDREARWLEGCPEQKQLPPPAAPSIYEKIPIVEVTDSGGGFWEVLVDGRMVAGFGGADAHQRATAKAAEILKGYGAS